MDMNSSIEKAMILAAGEGTRLRPLTDAVPKCLLPMGKTPIIKHQLRWLKRYGVRKVAVNLYHKSGEIKAALGDGVAYGVEIHYSPEETLLGTAGGVKRMEAFFNKTGYVVYGDTVSDVNLSSLAEFHRRKQALMTIVLFETENPSETGIVEIDEDGKVTGFTEKPLKGKERGNLSNGGIYILEPEILDYINDAGFCDFGFDVYPRLIEENVPVYGYRLDPDEYLIDIGTIENYRQVNEDINTGKVKIYHEE
jgi:NDP-sugar pyrophosphorylase family protein